MPLLGAVEVGGTHVRCAVSSSWVDVTARVVDLATRDPEETVRAIAQALAHLAEGRTLDAVGVATFGPLLADGTIASTTPKVAWRGVDWPRALSEVLGSLPLGLDTDTDAAVLAEVRVGRHVGEPVVVYVTVGTGVGGGIAVDGQVLHGRLHPELGHQRVPRLPDDQTPSTCPSHADCVEGLASGAAIARRAGVPGDQLHPDHPALVTAATYLGTLCANLLTTVSPTTLVLGGGVLQASGLLAAVRRSTAASLAGYLPDTDALALESILVAPSLAHPGLVGAWLLAEQALAAAELSRD